VGVLVRDARAAAARLAALGLLVRAWEEYGPGELRIAFIPVGETLIELIEPLTDQGWNAEWLRTHGEGVQHVALAVDDLAAALAALRARGVALADEAPRRGAGNTLIAFLRDPAGGVLVELTQPLGPPPWAA
jgi:methylmalonyl-CoA epimerase